MLFQHDPAEPIGVWDDVRETDVTERGIREMQALSIDPDVYDTIDAPQRAAPISRPFAMQAAIGKSFSSRPRRWSIRRLIG